MVVFMLAVVVMLLILVQLILYLVEYQAAMTTYGLDPELTIGDLTSSVTGTVGPGGSLTFRGTGTGTGTGTGVDVGPGGGGENPEDCNPAGGGAQDKCRPPKCRYKGVEPKKTQNSLELHTVQHHALGAPPRPGINPDGRFKTGDPNAIWKIIQKAARIGSGRWKVQIDPTDENQLSYELQHARARCVQTVNVGTTVGWDDIPSRGGKETSCIMMVIENRLSGLLVTAFPVRC
jgi:hypothetical protein